MYYKCTIKIIKMKHKIEKDTTGVEMLLVMIVGISLGMLLISLF